MKRPNPILALMAILTFVVSGLPSSFEVFEAPNQLRERTIKWSTDTIQIALSSSLTSSSPAIKPESDVLGAVHRALASWSKAANIKFVEVASKDQSVSPTSGGDGVSLITIAGTDENLALFADENSTARTRVFYDPDTGQINEADVVINPYPYSESGAPIQFSTDGTPGTYDLESTLAHEIGHLVGLTHSHVVGATMQATQALNGTYGEPAISERTLSEADLVAIRSLYGRQEKSGSIEGKIQKSVSGNLIPESAAHVWIEDLTDGRVVASTVTSGNGKFAFGSVPAGSYRAMVEYLAGPKESEAFLEAKSARVLAFRSVEIRNLLRVTADKITPLNYVLVPPQDSLPELKPRFIGLKANS